MGDRWREPRETWGATLRGYVLFMRPANLAWESLPSRPTRSGKWNDRRHRLSVVHCTMGDLLIAPACLAVALILLGDAS